MKKIIVLSMSVLLGALMMACGPTEKESANPRKPKIMASFYPMYEFTKKVVGDEAEVELLVPAGVEAHDYEPSAKDMARLSSADAVVFNSPEMETWVKKVAENTGDQVVFIEAAKELKLVADSAHSHDEAEADHDDHNHDHGSVDPHVWLDPQLAQKEVATIAEKLGAEMPEKKAIFEKNAEAYIAELAKLDQAFQTAFTGKKQRTFVTQHAAFGYLAERYQLEQASVSGLTPDGEPTPKRLAELKTFVKDHQISTIYFEENATSKVAETLAKEANLTVDVLNTLESLSEKDQQAGKNYLSVMTDNLEALKKSIK